MKVQKIYAVFHLFLKASTILPPCIISQLKQEYRIPIGKLESNFKKYFFNNCSVIKDKGDYFIFTKFESSSPDFIKNTLAQPIGIFIFLAIFQIFPIKINTKFPIIVRKVSSSLPEFFI